MHASCSPSRRILLHLTLIVLSSFNATQAQAKHPKTPPSLIHPLSRTFSATPAQPGPCREGNVPVFSLSRHRSHCKTNPQVFFHALTALETCHSQKSFLLPAAYTTVPYSESILADTGDNTGREIH